MKIVAIIDVFLYFFHWKNSFLFSINDNVFKFLIEKKTEKKKRKTREETKYLKLKKIV